MKISHHIFVFKFILLNIFYSSLYHSNNVIMLLDSFSHVAKMLKPTNATQLELQNMKGATKYEEHEGYQPINAKRPEP